MRNLKRKMCFVHQAALAALICVAAAAATAQTTLTGQGAESFRATLDPGSEVPAPNIGSATPWGSATFASDGPTLKYKVEATGLSSELTGAHIHAGAPGAPGPVVVPLALTAGASGSAAGEGVIDAGAVKGRNADGSPMSMQDLLALLRSGNAYVNVHTANNKSGEIRGQIYQQPASQTAPAKPSPFGASGAPIPGVANLGPSREIKLAEDTWFRFAVQIQAWAQAQQDRLTTGGDGSYAYNFLCRRCRFFATGSVVKNVFFNFLFEATPGRADPVTGVKANFLPQVLDAYAQVKFADWFWLSGGSILLPLTRNGTQPTTTYLSIDGANVDSTPVLQGNTAVLRDLGFQANGFFLDNHLEYRLGVYQGTRQAATTFGTPPVTTQSAGHNPPRVVASLMLDFWDPEVGYVNGGHYFGTKKVLGVMGNFDYQVLRKDGPPAAGTDKNPYYGISAAAFLNLPLSGQASRTGGDEIAALAQFGYYDGGFTQSPTGVTTNPGSYSNVLKQTNYLAEAAYFNKAAKFSVFGKYEKRKVSDDYVAAVRAASNVTWIAGGLKYYVAPANLMNFALQYERIIFDDAPGTQQGGTNNITFQMQTILY